MIFNRWIPSFRRVHGNGRLHYPLWDGMDHMMVTNGGSKASGCYAVYPIPQKNGIHLIVGIRLGRLGEKEQLALVLAPAIDPLPRTCDV